MPIIIVYPDYSSREDISDNNTLKSEIKALWDKLPILRDNMNKVPTIHIAMNKKDITSDLNDSDFCINTKVEKGRFFYK